MAQSVKLKDGSYIDTSAVYDTALSKTQSELNAEKYWEWNMTEYGPIFNCSSGLVYAYQKGRIVIFSMQAMAYKSRETSNYGKVCLVSLNTLGLPAAKHSFTGPIITGGTFLGEISINDSNILIRTNGAQSTLWGTCVYVTYE